ncbi:hypothetical protein T440DRAFT_484272 [Plenodomus tracheiphilus IPT5]|uniref:HMG box domain-containing protein n=1 Tax=Plenodomus tracheiphilus IPT5 TaxID=1408161 RepID=A0A6A7AMC9_9PLEO|nr:hypothetical protein T440DRAFT_484272 [Plenodomus tracheiphilus IPT5]
MAMRDLEDRLGRLEMAQYYQVFAHEGFDSWSILMDITERDLLLAKQQKQKLQRAIVESRKKSFNQPSPSVLRSEFASKGSDTRVKRKYQRHPKPDKHVPQQSTSAYLRFSNQIRQSLKEQNLSFAESAKVISDSWQALPTGEYDRYTWLAANAEEGSLSYLAEYKNTPQFEIHQRNLEAEDARSLKEQESHKLETGRKSTTRTDNRDAHEHVMDNRSVQPGIATMRNQRSVVSLTMDNVHLSADSCPSELLSSTKIPLSGFKTHNSFLPSSTISQSAATRKQHSVKTMTSHPKQPARSPVEEELPYPQLPPFATLLFHPYDAEY